jgi:hypothetical protein
MKISRLWFLLVQMPHLISQNEHDRLGLRGQLMMRRRADFVMLATALISGAAMCATSPCVADATLSIQHVGLPNGPFPQGQMVQVKVRMSSIPATTPAAGFQAFLRYDTTRLNFVSGTYTSVPFGLAITQPIAASGEHINIAAAINFVIGQPPSSADADLATLTFEITTACGMGAVEFRASNPPTRLSDVVGQPILPIVLNDLSLVNTCPGDVHASGIVTVADLLLIISNWGACPTPPACCAGNANGDALVGVADLLTVIVGWGACP